MTNTTMNERTPQEQAAWERFKRDLDNRYFHIEPGHVPFRGSALSAKHVARELLEVLPAGESVRVHDRTGTIWFQRKP